MRVFHVTLLVLFFVSGCSSKQTPRAPLPTGPLPDKPTTMLGAKAVSKRPANHNGVVLVIEYHKIAKEEARWDRSVRRFGEDLSRLYSMGFRPVTLHDYVSAKMALPPGASPVVITFDDSTPSQLALGSGGSVVPDCAVGIWRTFAKDHPDFPVHATFFVLPDAMWGQPKLVDRKLELLKGLGCEIGSHTVTHSKLSHLSDEQVKKELGGAIEFLATKGIGQPVGLALPYGISPKNKALLHGFTWNGRDYKMYAALLVGAGPAPAPSELKDPFRIPRIQGIEGLDGISFWLDAVEKGKVKPYVE